MSLPKCYHIEALTRCHLQLKPACQGGFNCEDLDSKRDKPRPAQFCHCFCRTLDASSAREAVLTKAVLTKAVLTKAVARIIVAENIGGRSSLKPAEKVSKTNEPDAINKLRVLAIMSGAVAIIANAIAEVLFFALPSIEAAAPVRKRKLEYKRISPSQ